MVVMDPILVVMAPQFEEIELTAPVDILRRLGVPVTLAGLEGLEVRGAHDVVMKADMLLVDADTAQFSGILLPGGPASWTLSKSPAVLSRVREMHAAGKLVAAICAAPLALEAAGVISGRRVTCWPGVAGELKSAAAVTGAVTETDGNIVTGRGPAASLEFGFAVAGKFVPGDKISAEREGMCMVD